MIRHSTAAHLRAAAASAAAATLLAVSASPAHASQTLKLDIRSATQTNIAGPVYTAPLAAGQAYVIKVRGTASIWYHGLLETNDVCGAPEAAPLEGSPGAENGPVGWDAETVFAAPNGVELAPGFQCVPGAIPFSTRTLYSGLQTSVDGTNFGHLMPVGGYRNAPRADHTYYYDVTGTGAPAAFRFRDNPSNDNYGVFTYDVYTAAECEASNCKGTSTTGGAGGVGGTGPGGSAPAGVAGDQILPISTLNSTNGSTSATTIGLPKARSCKAATVLSLRLTHPKGVSYSKASFYIGKKKIGGTIKGSKLKKAIKLRKLPTGKFTLTVRVTTTRGQVLTAKRKYSSCLTPKKKASKIKV